MLKRQPQISCLVVSLFVCSNTNCQTDLIGTTSSSCDHSKASFMQHTGRPYLERVYLSNYLVETIRTQLSKHQTSGSGVSNSALIVRFVYNPVFWNAWYHPTRVDCHRGVLQWTHVWVPVSLGPTSGVYHPVLILSSLEVQQLISISQFEGNRLPTSNKSIKKLIFIQ